jgi:GDPmannose 4,6-dehydratase
LRVLISGITGQDGFYLSELLNKKGYEVFGIRRRSTQETEVPEGVVLLQGDITDPSFVRYAVKESKPDEVYHLAAMSHVGDSFRVPSNTLETNAIGTLNMLEAVNPNSTKVYQASTSELFGDSPPPQSEETPMRPRSPYAISKLAGYWLTRNYRDRGMYAVNGILFNHESPRRGLDFVTQKVCQAAAKKRKVKLGNLSAKRDWGHAEDYVYGMWLMLQQPTPSDYVLATGKAYSVEDLCDTAYGLAGLDWREFVDVDPKLFRPTEVENLRGDPSKAEAIGWRRKHTFQTLIAEMMNAAISK